MELLTARDYQTTAWRNGGGQTTEIAIGPAGAGLDETPFAWRVSIADVAVDGPFSAFAGYDRSLTVIAGNGIQLDAGDHGHFDIGERFKPVEFSGDWAIKGRLIDGPVRDFNVMTNRAKARATVTMLSVGGDTVSLTGVASVLLLHMFEGAAVTFGQSARLLQSGETLLDRDHAPKAYDMALRAADGHARLALVEIDYL